MFPKTVTFFHKVFNKDTREDEFVRYVVKGVHFEHTKALTVANTKLQASDDVEIVIPLETVRKSDLKLKKDDVVVLSEVEFNIESTHDLQDYDYLKVTAIHYNDYALIDYLNNWTVIAR